MAWGAWHLIHTGHGRRRAGRGNPRGVRRLPTSKLQDVARYVQVDLGDVPDSGKFLTDVSSRRVDASESGAGVWGGTTRLSHESDVFKCLIQAAGPGRRRPRPGRRARRRRAPKFLAARLDAKVRDSRVGLILRRCVCSGASRLSAGALQSGLKNSLASAPARPSTPEHASLAPFVFLCERVQT